MKVQLLYFHIITGASLCHTSGISDSGEDRSVAAMLGAICPPVGAVELQCPAQGHFNQWEPGLKLPTQLLALINSNKQYTSNSFLKSFTENNFIHSQ